MIQIRKEENQKKQKEKKLKVYKVNTHKKTVIALWVLLAVSFLFAVYKNFTAIDIHTVHETKVINWTFRKAPWSPRGLTEGTGRPMRESPPPGEAPSGQRHSHPPVTPVSRRAEAP